LVFVDERSEVAMLHFNKRPCLLHTTASSTWGTSSENSPINQLNCGHWRQSSRGLANLRTVVCSLLKGDGVGPYNLSTVVSRGKVLGGIRQLVTSGVDIQGA